MVRAYSCISVYLGQSVYTSCPGILLLLVLPVTLKNSQVCMINYMLMLLICHDYKTGFYLINEGLSTGRRQIRLRL